MRILFVGDVFGKPGRKALREWLPGYRGREDVDFVIVNSENSASGKGVTAETARELFDAGADVLTGGNHTFAHRAAYGFLDEEERVLRPANLPSETPGRGHGVFNTDSGAEVAVINLLGRAFMKACDCPFRMGRDLVEEARRTTPIVIVDFHAEATSEKIAMAAHLDGLATAVIGTHTHVPTADARVSAAGTAAITDVGMTGPYDSVIGVKTDIILQQFLVGLPVRHEVATGDVRVCGLLVEVEESSGRATRATAVREPDFYRG
jgi:2',3'-cyclic-nucleotide 2'-phosphodiesterase